VLADEPERWEALGFTVSDATVQLGSVRIALVGKDAGRGIFAWSLRDLANAELDGLPTSIAEQSPTPGPPSTLPSPSRSTPPSPPTPTPTPTPTEHAKHFNGIVAIDHIVAMTPNLDRSVEALQVAGLDLRRIREQPTPAGAPRQAFFRLGEVILEVVQEPDDVLAARADGTDGPARFWGLALLSEDLELTVGQLGEHVSEIREAVQPGRRIATLRRSAGLAMPIALMSRPKD
jgi:hypothetical protein